MQHPTGPLASTRVSQNPDILPLILSHLPNASLFDCLLTSSTFFHTAVPLLYRSLTIRDQSDLFIGSTRSGASPTSSSFFPPLDNSSPSLSPASRPSPYSKNHSLTYVREVHLFTHGKNQCPFVRHYINPLPRLQLLHLARGHWPIGLDTADECTASTCQFIAKACCTSRRVLVRDMNLAPLASLTNLESVALKLRPCQLPMYLFHEAKYTWPWQLPLGRARVLDLIFWDERHAFRVDWHEIPGGGVGFMGGVGRLRAIPAGERQTTKLKGCTFCDERGCIRHSPNSPVQLPALAYALGRETEVRELRVWNGERSAEKQWSRDERMSGHKVLLLMEQAFLDGKRERYASQHGAGEVADKMSDVVVSFHSADEYYASPARWNGEMDEEEEDYWQLLTQPSPRIMELRREASKLMGLDETVFRQLGVEELEKYIEDEKMILRGGVLE
ncbi:hypothetical protein IAT38_000251 [Cryptococcus sp. DSM 104549]